VTLVGRDAELARVDAAVVVKDGKIVTWHAYPRPDGAARRRVTYDARMRIVMVVLVLVVVAIATPAVAQPAAVQETIAFGDGGLRVGSNVVVKSKVDAAAYDPAMELVWFTSKGTLQVLDLRDPKAKPVVIVKKMPQVGFAIVGASQASHDVDYVQAYLLLDVSKKKPKIVAEEGAYGPVDQAATNKLKKKIKKAKLVGQKWLKRLVKRALTSVTVPTPAAQAKVEVPPEMCETDDAEECGSAISFGQTPYHLVTTVLTCGDACHAACVLYDPKTKKFADPDGEVDTGISSWKNAVEDTGPCDGYHFAADAYSYYNGSSVCNVDRDGVACGTDQWYYVGLR
jgi:hypothetical protein